MVHHDHWEVDSVCPQCGKINHIKVPSGERLIEVSCSHCEDNHVYLHIVAEHTEVQDD